MNAYLRWEGCPTDASMGWGESRQVQNSCKLQGFRWFWASAVYDRKPWCWHFGEHHGLCDAIRRMDDLDVYCDLVDQPREPAA